MPCTTPLKAWRNHSGNIVFHCSLVEERTFEKLTLPCGQCIACRLARSREWAMRCMHEAQMHDFNCWLTLTYDDLHLPWTEMGYPTLDFRDIQLFLKRLRKSISPFKIRYYGCGEYGTQFNRPHYHFIIFGYDFHDKYLYRDGKFKLYNSPSLDAAWGLGHAVLADLSFESAAYTAQYCTKKVNGSDAEQHYYDRVPESSRQSSKPGIGASFYERFSADIISQDKVITRGGHASKPPRYYDKLLGRTNPELLEQIKQRRKENAVEVDDETLQRLAEFNQLKFDRMVRIYEQETLND